MYIGIIGAMEIETEKIISYMEDVKVKNFGPYQYNVGKLYGKNIVVSTCLEGKVNAAICTQLMISNFNIDFIINIGVAGGLDKKLDIGGIAISSATVEFDQDAVALGYEEGYTFGVDKVLIPCSLKAQTLYNNIKDTQNSVFGVIATSDKFVTDDNLKKYLVEKYDAIAVDMETASINHVCALNSKEFFSVRGISDTGSTEEFEEFLENAMENMNKVIFEFIKNI